ncbi:RidA family protein [Cryptosporangium phraense]|uniref:RidA family protein n=1 Tax=Cryptosporangium phraense TaxID=2593070 RepID=A0A545APC4_9ACTN|nr:RidA family protein [Cryptosporangium phraense]TQS43179.1 RidA family protein [Cryptosporangium phraense]
MNRVVRTDGETVGLYSPAVATPANTGLVFVSGVLSVDKAGETIHAGDFEAQMRNVFTLLGSVLEAAGSSFGELVKMTTYLVDPDHIADFYAVREVIFEDLFPGRRPPGNTLLVVRRLVRAEFLIEIEGVATTTRERGESDELVG